jgi:alcohol dehydrogenase (cytochrome c)/quinohemoprotein ethanol dehydrogenase
MRRVTAVITALLMNGYGAAGVAGRPASAGIDRHALVGATGNVRDWLSYGRTYDEQRFSPLDRINTANVHQLGLAWFADMDTTRGQEATPIVIDGKIYVSTAWSKVKAYDAVSGRLLWAYDPKVPGETGVKGCCDVVNRGLAAWGNSLFLGTFDGRLISLDRRTGKVNWSVVTVDRSKNYTITGAPRVIDGRVIIGNGGAEFSTRGYVTAYDARSGRQDWRFYTVPGKPGADKAAYLRKAAATWTGEWWKYGGGGTVWDSMAYDPDLDLLYIGVGNGSPWNQGVRSPGGGDNLYLSSIVAIRPKTGAYVWHYQTTPGDSWDYTATQNMILADLKIGGQTRKVLMQAPKNGFFYILDRATGRLISAKNFVDVNWASGIDPKTGRPIENPDARYYKTGKVWFGMPGPSGAHSWHPMAFNPMTGLVYIPAQIAGFPYLAQPGWQAKPKGFNTGNDFGSIAMPADNAVRNAALAGVGGALIAWDPAKQSERWRVSYKGPNNGGVLATAGGLIFQGSAASEFAAFDAADGRKLWSMAAQTGIVAPPVTYSVNGTQYVAVLAGWGGSWALSPGLLSGAAGPVRNISRLLVFKLGGHGRLPPEPPLARAPIDPPPVTGTPEQIAEGGRQFGRFCSVCHGDAAYGGTVLPDLRRSGLIADAQAWKMVVHGGALKDNGMVSFADVLSSDQIDAIRHYVIKRANEDKALGAR